MESKIYIQKLSIVGIYIQKLPIETLDQDEKHA